jgi:hypothetical protein
LYQEAIKNGIKIVTPDIFLNLKTKPKKTFLISHLYGNSEIDVALIKEGVVPLILLCQESPFIATRFYLNLKKYSSKFKHSIVFLGMKKMLSKKTVYQQMFFAQSYDLADFNPKKFTEKKLLTMICSAKFVGNWKKNLLLKLFYGFRIKEIYQERLKVIKYFADKNSFDLYGRGWDKIKLKLSDKLAVKKVFRGEVEDKFGILKDYKFTFCFENSVFPGYITEKIFDAMFAGSVPIYLGVSDIENYVGKDTFIDLRDFKDFGQLYDYLYNMSEEKYNQYLENIKKYICSDKYKIFSQEKFAENILEIIIQEVKKYV